MTDADIVKKAKAIFPTHKEIFLRVKKNAKSPFEKTVFERAIEMRNEHPLYKFYIHDFYLTFVSTSIKNAEPVKVQIDNKLWIELYKIFTLKK